MTPRTFFAVVIKILGIYLMCRVIFQVSYFITGLVTLISEGAIRDSIVPLFFYLLIAAVVIWLIYAMIFHTDKIVTSLRLDKGFSEEKFEFKLHHSSVLRIAVIILGGLMVINAIPDFFAHLYQYIETRKIHITNPTVINNLIVCCVKIIIGCCLVIYNRDVINFIELKRRKINNKT